MVFNSALIHLKNIGVSIFLGTIATIVSFFFIQNWSTLITIGSVVVSFAGAGYFFTNKRKFGNWYAGIFIVLPYYLTYLSGTENLHKDFIEILQNPGILTTDDGSFYLILPAVALVSSYFGILISKKRNAP
jgi:hypothetical protein